MSNFTKAVAKVLEHEGGFVDHPMDRGGATNWGITQKTYEDHVNREVSVDEIRNMPKGNAIAIYKQNYWDKVSADAIKNYAVAFVIFDQAVNRGISSASKQVQKVLQIYPDGIIGPETIKRLNAYDAKSFIDQYLTLSEKFYHNIVSYNPSQAVFLKGWLHRVESLQSYALKNVGIITSVSLVSLVAVGGLGYYLYSKGYFKNLRLA